MHAFLTTLAAVPPGPPTDAAELLRAAAFYGHTALLRLLQLLTPADAFVDNPELMPEVFEEACIVSGQLHCWQTCVAACRMQHGMPRLLHASALSCS